jgi:glucose-6-phosphate dehydrogenase assembly protein OpcA
MPVEVGQIHRELKKLWDEGGEVMTRASLINLAVYSEAPDSLAQNTRIMSEVTKEHACRAIVIAAHCSAAEDSAQAWISAHCHISRAGGKQICSEQLSFLLEGTFSKLLPNIVFSHLDSDLPFYLWWQGELPSPIDPHLWTWVDRLIYDSAEWTEFDVQMRLAETARAEANHRIVLCDLNWTRLILLRLALAQFFDHADARQQLARLERVEIDFAPGFARPPSC